MQRADLIPVAMSVESPVKEDQPAKSLTVLFNMKKASSLS